MLLKSKCYRYGELHTYCTTVLLTGNPVRHSLNHAYGLLVERRVNRLGNLYVSDRTVTLNHEGYDNTALYTILLSYYRVLDVLAQPLEQCALTTGEGRHYLYHVEDLGLLFLRRLRLCNHFLSLEHLTASLVVTLNVE